MKALYCHFVPESYSFSSSTPTSILKCARRIQKAKNSSTVPWSKVAIWAMVIPCHPFVGQTSVLRQVQRSPPPSPQTSAFSRGGWKSKYGTRLAPVRPTKQTSKGAQLPPPWVGGCGSKNLSDNSHLLLEPKWPSRRESPPTIQTSNNLSLSQSHASLDLQDKFREVHHPAHRQALFHEVVGSPSMVPGWLQSDQPNKLPKEPNYHLTANALLCTSHR